MATTTPNFGWTVPTSSDLVKNGATAIETLGDAIDASMVDLKGGTTGQVLAKASNTDMDFTWTTASSGSSYVAGKNLIINGGMDIWQRGTSIASSGSAKVYTADRWSFWRGGLVTGGTVTRQATADTTNLPFVQYCARVQRDSGNTSTQPLKIASDLESVNTIPYAGKSVTVTFYARKGSNYSVAASDLNCELLSGTGTDQQIINGYTGQTTVTSGFQTITTTWQRFTATGTVPATSTQLGIVFSSGTPVGTAGANDYFEVTGVQIEAASSSTAFCRNASTIQGELAACQRYYQKSYDQSTVPGTATSLGSLANSPNSIYFDTNFGPRFPVNLRTVPTITVYSTNTGASGNIYDASAGSDVSSSGGVGIGQTGCRIAATVISGRSYFYQYTAEAEL